MIRVSFWPVLVLVALTSAAERAHVQAPVFTTRVDAVRVDVLVTDGAQLVTGLRAEDFEVVDNGVAQHVDLVSFARLPLSVMLALDLSGSVGGERLDHLRSAAESVIHGLRPEDKVGLLTFSHEVTLRAGLTDGVATVRAALANPSTGGDTALVDASYSAMALSDSEAGRPLAIVFSDGADTASFLRAEDVLATARRSDTVVYAAVVGEAGRASFLRDLCEQTGGRVLGITSTGELGTTMRSLLREFRQRYLISYSPRGVPGAGWHRLEVRVPGRRAKVRARRGYIAER